MFKSIRNTFIAVTLVCAGIAVGNPIYAEEPEPTPTVENEFEDKIRDAEVRLAEAEKHLEEMEWEMLAADCQVSKLEESVNRAIVFAEQAEAKKEAALAKMNEAENEMNLANQALSDAKTRLADLIALGDEAADQVAGAAQAIIDAQTAADDKTAAYSAARSEYESASNNCRRAYEDVEMWKAEIEEAKAERSAVAFEYGNAKLAVASIQYELEAYRNGTDIYLDEPIEKPHRPNHSEEPDPVPAEIDPIPTPGGPIEVPSPIVKPVPEKIGGEIVNDDIEEPEPTIEGEDDEEPEDEGNGEDSPEERPHPTGGMTRPIEIVGTVIEMPEHPTGGMAEPDLPEITALIEEPAVTPKAAQTAAKSTPKTADENQNYLYYFIAISSLAGAAYAARRLRENV